MRSLIILWALPIPLLLSCNKHSSPNSTASGFQLPCFRQPTPRELVEKRPSNAPKISVKSQQGVLLKGTVPNRLPTPVEMKALALWVDSESFYGTIVPLTNDSPVHFNYVVQKHDAAWKDEKKYRNQDEFFKDIDDLANSAVGEGLVYRGEPNVSQAYALSLVNHADQAMPFKFSPPGRKRPIPITSSTNVAIAVNFACKYDRSNIESHRQQSIGLIYRIKTRHGYQLPTPFDGRENEVLLRANQTYRIKSMQAYDLGPNNKLLRGQLKDIKGNIIVKRLMTSDICYPILVDLEEI